MGCGGSKVKPQPPQAAAPPPPKPPTPPPKSPSVPSEASVVEEVEEVPLTPGAARLQNVIAVKETGFVYNKCTVTGEVTSFFPPKGQCFRIIDEEGRWFFYNDTMNYEMCVQVVIAPESYVEHCEATTVNTKENGETVISAVVYPLETLEFLSGSVVLNTVDVYAHPLSQQYYNHLQIISEEGKKDVEAVMALPWEEVDDEELLKLCSDSLVRYADINFLPSNSMFSRLDGDGRFIQPVEVRRPSEFAQCDEENIDAVRGVVLSSCVEAGTLGDSWFVSALSLLATDEERVKAMFASTTPAEKQTGAYRVLLNKDGWWKNILVDDFLPTVGGVPCYARCIDDSGELWPSLLQKAYAKLYGSYASITGGDTLLALQNFTGAPVYRFDKTWRDAATDEEKKNALIQKITGYVEAHNPVILSVPTGRKAATAVANGLREGYSYALLSVHNFPEENITLLKMFNPWEPAMPWSGQWREGSDKWTEHSEIQSSCEPCFEAHDGIFFIEWSEAVEVFNGCGVLYLDEKPVYDYRVAGEFDNEHPNLVLMIRAKETVEVVLTLSQRDKRGLPLESPDVKLSPVLLCVSRAEGNKQFVYQCSSSDPETPAEGFNFVVGRDVAMKCTFEASETPYFVIPRIHRGGTCEGRRKGFVIGIRSSTPLDEKLDIHFTTLEPTCRVFRNCVTFTSYRVPGAVREWQVKAADAEPTPFWGWGLSPAEVYYENNEEDPEAIREYIVTEAEEPVSLNVETILNDDQPQMDKEVSQAAHEESCELTEELEAEEGPEAEEIATKPAAEEVPVVEETQADEPEPAMDVPQPQAPPSLQNHGNDNSESSEDGLERFRVAASDAFEIPGDETDSDE
ncbi:cysteine peptidase, Clan CA, family C2, putative [Trypanosoma brucei gambiense DAL972]|uniref:Cysteine peptidase, Clan CA, family C2, putative n=1 Tax=Trypanosoma brucei gambiense (strain MHOM/CI/86/DAL972) TaxID=679716 RepID=C9ZN53_TRYB9|nr:cysteine peptidase, Clan CA, family C2, putative [Trypanosoma brucei gambiense DAL972]CBH10707.1 cysteine peptidase, Clan CA, family C2, putative [Trypanosoma brucei gambiense DAL972]|eukprot:XP_011772995.1 cysteine peptidase, Clan CA, family C2, putative [Trypanosoma brucei gambiense DAL972]